MILCQPVSTLHSRTVIGVDSTALTYDAFDRVVEKGLSSTYTQIVYGPFGNKLALMNGQTLSKAFVPLPGGGSAVYISGPTLSYYRHADWLGSSRLASTPSRTIYSETAYAPFGETYLTSGTADPEFAGMNQDIVSSGPYPLYDALYRENNSTWGRWLSPDPAGLSAADPSNPQSWNRYAYALNNPLSLYDPLGLCEDEIVSNHYSATQHEPPCANNGGDWGWFGDVNWGGGVGASDNPSTGDSLRHVGHPCLNQATISAIDAGLLALFNRTFGTDVKRNDPNEPTRYSTTPNGTRTLRIGHPPDPVTKEDTGPRIPVNKLPAHPGTPLEHPDFSNDVRIAGSVGGGPADYGHIVYNPANTDPRDPLSIKNAEVHGDIGGGLSGRHLIQMIVFEGVLQHGINSVGHPCVIKFADFGAY